MWGEFRLRCRQIGDCHRLVHIRVEWFAFYAFHTPSVLVFFFPFIEASTYYLLSSELSISYCQVNITVKCGLLDLTMEIYSTIISGHPRAINPIIYKKARSQSQPDKTI